MHEALRETRILEALEELSCRVRKLEVRESAEETGQEIRLGMTWAEAQSLAATLSFYLGKDMGIYTKKKLEKIHYRLGMLLSEYADSQIVSD